MDNTELKRQADQWMMLAGKPTVTESFRAFRRRKITEPRPTIKDAQRLLGNAMAEARQIALGYAQEMIDAAQSGHANPHEAMADAREALAFAAHVEANLS